MLRLKDDINPIKLGFECKDHDYVYYVKIDGIKKLGFTIYKGSPYIRYSKTAYIVDEQLKCIYEWVKNDYVEWEDQ